MITLFGIPNCDSCRKARKWLEGQRLEYRFHDVREDGLESDELTAWADVVGWQRLLNTRSTTWRNLPASDREDVNQETALRLIEANPTLLKRPVAVVEDQVVVGFSADDYRALR